jgi:hypothetical protein
MGFKQCLMNAKSTGFVSGHDFHSLLKNAAANVALKGHGFSRAASSLN